MAGGSPVVEVKELTKRYGSFPAVDRVSFTVNRGEIVALLGPNGAGKSTTMKMLTCFMPATSGTARVAGYDIWDDSLEVRRRLGYMPENTPLYTEMRVREYIAFRARLKGVPPRQIRKRVEEVAERCWVNEVLDRIIGQLSKGYRQRVGLAECLIHDPAILILDEPTIGLDPAQIRETRKLIKEVGSDRTVILSTHILPEAEMVCNRVLIINRGRLIPEKEIEKLRRASAVVLEARGDAAAIEKALTSVSGVTKVTRTGDGGDGASRFEVEGAGSARTREAISRALVEAGTPASEIKPVGTDLEEIFVRITARDDAA
ncbi:MAG: ATP-binding cassette domain-containing protein [Planctomycetota bacterium]